MSDDPEIYIRSGDARIDLKRGKWFLTDCRGDVWQLVMTGEPDLPLRIVIIQRFEPK